jgi:hypothetical protein
MSAACSKASLAARPNSLLCPKRICLIPPPAAGSRSVGSSTTIPEAPRFRLAFGNERSYKPLPYQRLSALKLPDALRIITRSSRIVRLLPLVAAAAQDGFQDDLLGDNRPRQGAAAGRKGGTLRHLSRGTLQML